MAVHASTSKTFNQPSPQVTQTQKVIAPIKGIDSRTVLSAGDPSYCIYAYNLIPNEYGLRVRKGYREWQIETETAPSAGLGIGTIIPYGGVDGDATDDRLFAVTNEGIWDVTVAEAAPILKIDFSDPANGGDTSAEAGYGVYTQYTTDADEQILYYADSANGLFQYSETTDLWTRSTGITGPVIEDIIFVTSHKSRIWFIEKDSSKAWYLPLAAISGTAVEFFFGSKFKHGGNLAGLFSWTIDGGSGVDDYFVSVSRAGDVMIYAGNDPASADDWSSQGQYFIGAVPKGNRFGSEAGGNLHLLSVFGLVSMEDLLRGVDGKDIAAQTQTFKIATVIRKEMELYRNDKGWDVKFIPSIGSIVITQPVTINSVYKQFVFNSVTQGWGIWRGVPIVSYDEWRGKVYLGTADNRVMVMDVTVDNVLITPTPPLNGFDIPFSVLTTFQDYGQPTVFKRGKYIRPQFVAKGAPKASSKFRYDYDLSEVLASGTNDVVNTPAWDIDNWDEVLWAAGSPVGFNPVSGGWGMGRYVAIAMSGSTREETTLISWDVMWDTGAPL